MFITTMKNNIIEKGKTFIIAEIGNNHEGNFQLAKKMILEAWKCGVSAVKLQYIEPKFFFGDEKQIKKYKKFQFSEKQINQLIKFSIKKKILLFWTFFDFKNFDKFKSRMIAFKISSTDNNFSYFIQKVIKERKQTFISLGLYNNKQIDNLVKFLIKLDVKCYEYVSLLHCSSSYPLKNSEANLSQIIYLKKKYPKFKIGYSDHTVGTVASTTAISLGAEIIEKHFTINKKQSKFRDHSLSADITDMKEIVSKSHIIKDLLRVIDIKKTEQYKNIKSFRRFITFKNLKKIKDKIKIDDLLFLRSKGKISVQNLEKILKNNKLKKNIRCVE